MSVYFMKLIPSVVMWGTLLPAERLSIYWLSSIFWRFDCMSTSPGWELRFLLFSLFTPSSMLMKVLVKASILPISFSAGYNISILAYSLANSLFCSYYQLTSLYSSFNFSLSSLISVSYVSKPPLPGN